MDRPTRFAPTWPCEVLDRHVWTATMCASCVAWTATMWTMLGGVSGSQVARWDLDTCDLMVLHFSEVAKHMTSLLVMLASGKWWFYFVLKLMVFSFPKLTQCDSMSTPDNSSLSKLYGWCIPYSFIVMRGFMLGYLWYQNLKVAI